MNLPIHPQLRFASVWAFLKTSRSLIRLRSPAFAKAMARRSSYAGRSGNSKDSKFCFAKQFLVMRSHLLGLIIFIFGIVLAKSGDIVADDGVAARPHLRTEFYKPTPSTPWRAPLWGIRYLATPFRRTIDPLFWFVVEHVCSDVLLF